MRLESVADLRTVYRPPGRGAVDKVIDHIDAHCADFLAMAPFFVLSTAASDGTCDVSPKGGPPGFVEALDDRRLAWADYSGNNRLDSLENVAGNDHVAILVFIPGMDETLRVNGRAELTTDSELCARFEMNEKPARVVVVVTVQEAYIHCAKALRRGAMWSPESWPADDELPSAACILKDHAAVDVDPAVIESALEREYDATLWEPGGGD
ncbi:MAG: MSMEG_1061 family FMN-dependent PPOX-type flavoprotein [Ilumatobacteraceae bacterium]